MRSSPFKLTPISTTARRESTSSSHLNTPSLLNWTSLLLWTPACARMAAISPARRRPLRQGRPRPCIRPKTQTSNLRPHLRSSQQEATSHLRAAKRLVLLARWSSSDLPTRGHVTDHLSSSPGWCPDLLRGVCVQQQPFYGRAQCAIPRWVQCDFGWDWVGSAVAGPVGGQAQRVPIRNSVRDNVPGLEAQG